MSYNNDYFEKISIRPWNMIKGRRFPDNWRPFSEDKDKNIPISIISPSNKYNIFKITAYWYNMANDYSLKLYVIRWWVETLLHTIAITTASTSVTYTTNIDICDGDKFYILDDGTPAKNFWWCDIYLYYKFI